MGPFTGVFKHIFAGLLILFYPAISHSQDTLKSQYGWLQFSSNADSLYLIREDDFSTYIPLIQGDSLEFKAGVYHFTFVNRHYWDEKLVIQVLPRRKLHLYIKFHHKIRKDFNRSSYKRITEGLPYNLILFTDPASTIVIDDSIYGKRFIKTDIGPYYHTIYIRHPSAKDRKERIFIEPSEQITLHMYDRPDRTTARIFSVIPGASQLYKNQNLKGAAFIALSTGSLLLFLHMTHRYRKMRMNYNRLNNRYLGQIDESKAYQYGLRAQHAFNSMKSAARIRNVALEVTLGVFTANVIDALFSTPKGGYRVHIGVAPTYQNDQASLKMNMKVNFK